MDHQAATRVSAALLLLAGVGATVLGGAMFGHRDGPSDGLPPSPVYYAWERSFVLAAVPLTVVGLVQTTRTWEPDACSHASGRARTCSEDRRCRGRGHRPDRRGGGRVSVDRRVHRPNVPRTAAIGGGLRQADLLAPWIGWTTIVWNLGALMALVVLTPHNVYYRLIHHVAPLLIGGALVRRAAGSRAATSRQRPAR